MSLDFILILFFIFWALCFQRRVLYYLYFWQLKTYRLDRFWENVKRDKRIIFPKTSLGVLVLWLLVYFSLINKFLAFYILFGFYLVGGTYAIYLGFKKAWRLPIFTKKVSVLYGLLFLCWGFLAYYLFTRAIFLLLLLELCLPFILLIYFMLVELPVFCLKQRLIRKAKKKINTFKDLTVIGITGSYGKSSTKEFLYKLLIEKYGATKVLKTEGNINVDIGIANTVLKDLNSAHQFFICEMAAYRRGEVKASANIVKPRLAILTGVNEQHLELFGSMDNIIKTKYELVEALPETGVAFFNAKDNYTLDLYHKTKVKKYLYGAEVAFKGLENIVGAKMVAEYLGVSAEEITQALNKINNQFAGVALKKGLKGTKVLEATYSANPDGVLAHLAYIQTLPGKKVLVMPCLIELGSASERIHRTIAKKAKEVCDLIIITTADRFKEIKEEIGAKAVLLKETSLIFEKVEAFVTAGDIILLESRMPAGLTEKILG